HRHVAHGRDAAPQHARTHRAPAPAAGPAAPADLRSIHDPHIRPVRARPPGRRHGLDLGWLAACAGLVTAATLLGRSATASPRSRPGAPRARPAPARRTTAPARKRPADSIAACPITSPRRSTT